jgi:hypothetical protein
MMESKCTSAEHKLIQAVLKPCTMNQTKTVARCSDGPARVKLDLWIASSRCCGQRANRLKLSGRHNCLSL